eukprot:CCRYP_017254-RA/>CCRYP_017254-RA protein AED:0.45 eAED:0.55 QI:0/0/0.5/1/0/0/2/199/104
MKTLEQIKLKTYNKSQIMHKTNPTLFLFTLLTGGVLRMVRALSHSADSRREGMVDIFWSDVVRSAMSSSLVAAARAGWTGAVNAQVMDAVAIVERKDLRDDCSE